MSITINEAVTGTVITGLPVSSRQPRPPRARPVHHAGSRCRHAHAWSADPLAVTCGSCRRTNRWLPRSPVAS